MQRSNSGQFYIQTKRVHVCGCAYLTKCTIHRLNSFTNKEDSSAISPICNSFNSYRGSVVIGAVLYWITAIYQKSREWSKICACSHYFQPAPPIRIFICYREFYRDSPETGNLISISAQSVVYSTILDRPRDPEQVKA